MSTRIWEFCRVKVGWVSRVVGGNAKPMSRIRAADVKIIPDNAKPMPRRMRSRCQDKAKPMSSGIWEFCRVKVGWVSRIVGFSARPMAR